MEPNKTDEEIVLAYQKGDQEIFKELINRYTKPLYNFTARITNTNEASDIVQEIFIKIWKHIWRFDPKKASFKTWLFTIARNTATDFLRKKRTLLFSDIEYSQGGDGNFRNESSDASFSENIPDGEILPDAALEKLEDKEFLNKTMQKLSEEENEILILHYQEEMTFDDIGKILQKSSNTVKSKHRRALAKLKKILE